METTRFFEHRAQRYVNTAKEGDRLKLCWLKELAQAGDSFLDVGGGSGYFCDMVLAETPISLGIVMDSSEAMLAYNRQVRGKEVCSGSVFNMPFKPESFRFVHADAVLHHLVGTTRKSSVEMAWGALRNMIAVTKKDGFLLLSEPCVESYLNSFSSAFIFYALRVVSYTKLRVAGIPPGLVVSFLTPGEFLNGISSAGACVTKTEMTHHAPSVLHRLALCKDLARVHVLASPV